MERRLGVSGGGRQGMSVAGESRFKWGAIDMGEEGEDGGETRGVTVEGARESGEGSECERHEMEAGFKTWKCGAGRMEGVRKGREEKRGGRGKGGRRWVQRGESGCGESGE